MTRAVLDPNVLISAFIARHDSAPAAIVREWAAGAFELIVSPRLLAELGGVLERPKFEAQAGLGRAEAYLESLTAGATIHADPVEAPSVSPDPDDDYLFALAAASDAAMIVSGDGHLTGLASPPIAVLTPRAFADRLAAT